MKLEPNLPIPRCPHCRIDQPNMIMVWGPFRTNDHGGRMVAFWGVYRCQRCGGCVLASAPGEGKSVGAVYPEPQHVPEEIPSAARRYLSQAMDSIHAPAGAVMLAASAVDAMLKAKGLTTGRLYTRIREAAANHLITDEMAAWAHDVRLDANDERHADEEFANKTTEDAARSVEFAAALAQFLFVLPAKVQRGREAAKK